MTSILTSTDFDAAGQAIAFARAFISSDAEGANAMLLSLPADQLPAFTSMLCTITANALEVGGVPVDPFFDAMTAMIDEQAGHADE